jgi:predicted transcriptional regulator
MPAFGDLEVQVMRRIWARRGPVTVREVLGDLQRDRTIAYTTVMTVMGNLEKKGWLRRHANGRAYHYEPLVSAEEGVCRSHATASYQGTCQDGRARQPTSQGVKQL